MRRKTDGGASQRAVTGRLSRYCGGDRKVGTRSRIVVVGTMCSAVAAFGLLAWQALTFVNGTDSERLDSVQATPTLPVSVNLPDTSIEAISAPATVVMPELELHGVLAARPGEGYALIGAQGSVPKPYRVGEEIVPGVLLETISVASITIRTVQGLVQIPLTTAHASTVADPTDITPLGGNDLHQVASLADDPGMSITFGSPPPPDAVMADMLRALSIEDDETSVTFGPPPDVDLGLGHR